MPRETGASLESAPVLELTLSVPTIPPSGHQVTMDPTAETRARLAATYGLVDVPAFTATADVRRTDDGATVTGRVKAEVVASCVVTLQPVTQAIDERFEIKFVHEGAARVTVDPALLPEDEDPPEIIVRGEIAIGALLEEHFVLALDPYPRAEGAEIPEEFSDAGRTEDASPFASLAALREVGADGGKPDEPKD